jgi:hypothetical protein
LGKNEQEGSFGESIKIKSREEDDFCTTDNHNWWLIAIFL